MKPSTYHINKSIAFGGQIAYLWRSNLGAEFLADFAPTFKIPSLVISDHPSLSAYMFNAIYGFRIGSGGRFRPYISAGIGAINMSADLLTIDTNLIQSTITASQSRFGGDVGVGTMGYLGTRRHPRGYPVVQGEQRQHARPQRRQ